MSNFENTIKKLSNGIEVCYVEDFYDAAIRIAPVGKGNYKIYLKFRHRKEHEVENSNETALLIELGGKEITIAEYLKF